MMHGRRATASVLLVGALVLSGCSQGTESRTDMTLNDAQRTTVEHMEALIARIDPALIGRIDKATDDSSGCRGNDVDPEQRVRQWQNRRSVWFVDSVRPLDGLTVLDKLVAGQVDDGWTLARDGFEEDGTVRRVQLASPELDGNAAGTGFRVSIAGGSEVGGLTSLNISAVSPCFEVAEGESWD
jgi:hypothetical protein